MATPKIVTGKSRSLKSRCNRQKPARAVLVYGFHIHVTLIHECLRTDYLREKCFGCRVTVQDAIFGAFFVVDNELHGNTCLIWPLGVRDISSVAAQVARIISVRHCCDSTDWYQLSITVRSSSLMPVRLPIGITRVTTVC